MMLKSLNLQIKSNTDVQEQTTHIAMLVPPSLVKNNKLYSIPFDVLY